MKFGGGILMPYIISNASVVRRNELVRESFLIRNERIHAVRPSFPKDQLMKVDASPYTMTPGHVGVFEAIPTAWSMQQLRTFWIENAVTKGMTTIVAKVEVEQEKEWRSALRYARLRYNNCPVDYTLAVQLPLSQLTPTVVRLCAKDSISILFLEIGEDNSVEKMPWSLLDNHTFGYKPVLVPVITADKRRKERQLLKEWADVLASTRFPYVHTPMPTEVPLSLDVLKQIGIYPYKGFLHQGGEVTYNLYDTQGSHDVGQKVVRSQDVSDSTLRHGRRNFSRASLLGRRDLSLASALLENPNTIPYYESRLVVTVHKGNILRAGEELFLSPGRGEELRIRVPQFFRGDFIHDGS